METQLARIVNKSTSIDFQHACLQNVQTNAVYEFSQIVGDTITDGDLSHSTIQRILNDGHQVNISVDENNNVTLHF
jgi:hypothetical protein